MNAIRTSREPDLPEELGGLMMKASASDSDVPLILFSGMGADASIFLPQRLAFPNLIVPEWIPPQKAEGLESYCARFAQTFAPQCPCVVGGASFGGVVALEMTRHLETLGCILIGSVRGPDELPKRIRMLRSFAPTLSIAPISLMQWAADSAAVSANRVGVKHLAGVSRQFAKSDPAVLRWSAQTILSWDSSYESVNVRHIHGDRDCVFPIGCVRPDKVVLGGGHVISMTHGSQVNEFIREQLVYFIAA